MYIYIYIYIYIYHTEAKAVKYFCKKVPILTFSSNPCCL